MVETRMGRIYVAGQDSGFGCSLDDIVAHGLKYLEGSISLPTPPTIPPSVSYTMEETMVDEMTDDLCTNQNRRRSFGYDEVGNYKVEDEEEEEDGDDYEGDYYFNGVNDRDMDM